MKTCRKSYVKNIEKSTQNHRKNGANTHEKNIKNPSTIDAKTRSGKRMPKLWKKGPKGSPNGAQNPTKMATRSQRGAKGGDYGPQMKRKGAKGEANGPQMKRKGAKGEAKEAERRVKGA